MTQTAAITPTTTTTVAIVLGFYGSQPKHVEKYAQVWRQQIPGVDKVISSPCAGNPLVLLTAGFFDAIRVYKELSKACAKSDNADIFIHVLSNRGMLVYLSLVNFILPWNEQWRRHRGKHFKVRGVVFDSCPGSLNPALFFRATAANQTVAWKRYAFESMPPLILIAIFLRRGLYGTFIRVGLMEIWSRLASYVYHFIVSRLDQSRSPSLFLYSDADVLVSSGAVERVIAAREAHIGQVRSKKWPDSAHVKHLLNHEQEYIAELQAFVARLVLL